MSPSSNFPNYTTNESYGGFYDSPRISLHAIPKRVKNYQLDSRKTAHATTSAEYGGFLRGSFGPSPRWFVAPNSPKPRSPIEQRDGSFWWSEQLTPRSPTHRTSHSPPIEPINEVVLHYNDRQIRLPDVDTVELHMKDKSRILLSVKEFYRRYFDN